MTSELILEIGTEEIPSGYLTDALEQLRTLAERYLENYRIAYQGEIKSYGTPRRLVLIISGLSQEQATEESEILGPPENVAFDKEGRPTKAYQSFLEKFNGSPEELSFKETNKGRYLVLKRSRKGKKTSEVLSEILPLLIGAIAWPKSMRWADIKTAFVRPVHWILALLDGNVLDFEFAGIRSKDLTYGHRFLAPGPLKVAGISDYMEKTRKAMVMVDPERRKQEIIAQIKGLLNGKNLEATIDEDLLNTVTNLVEWPFVFMGGFEERYLKMPEEILITVMKTHQRYFPVRYKEGALAPYFIAVNNTKVKDLEKAVKGNERVLKARFRDAEFFYEEDLKKPLIDRLEGLKGVVFHVSLGSSYDKVMRFTKTAKYLANKINAEIEEKVELACTLSKCDLLTHMVFEFPELQGVVGRHYAEMEGYPSEISDAIEQHYWPSRANDDISRSDIANCVGIADRIDTIVGFFAINQIPTGNADPFALRRHALAILRIIEEMGYSIDLKDLIWFEIENYMNILTFDKKEIFDKVYDFFKERLRYKLLRSGYSQDIIESIIAFDIDPISEITEKINILHKNYDSNLLLDITQAFKRVNNIIKSQREFSQSSDLLKENSEIELIKALNSVEISFCEAIKRKDYLLALSELATLRPYVDRLFEEVEIMSKDPNLRAQRLGLLHRVKDMFLKWADFSKLTL